MQASSRVPRGALRWLNAIVAVVAIAAQLYGALSPLGEARQTRSSAAHVEQGGTSSHWAHNEESCAVCQARSVHAALPRVPTLNAVSELATAPLVKAAERVASAELRSLSNPRAPPGL